MAWRDVVEKHELLAAQLAVALHLGHRLRQALMFGGKVELLAQRCLPDVEAGVEGRGSCALRRAHLGGFERSLKVLLVESVRPDLAILHDRLE